MTGPALVCCALAMPVLGSAAQEAAPSADTMHPPIQLEVEDLPPEVIEQSKPKPAPSKEADPAKPGAADAKQRIIYLPDSERQKIRDEIRDEVMATARKENWAQPNTVPDWLQRIHPMGDLRVRAEGDFFEKDNDNEFLDFRSINAGAPLNTTPPAAGQPIVVPTLNTTEDRQLFRLRARLGFVADIADSVNADFRLATGNVNNPGSTNQTLGDDFNKVNFLVDRADIRYRMSSWGEATVGRMANPESVSGDVVWDRDLSFDGINLKLSHQIGKDVGVKAQAGIFAVENTDPNYPQSSIVKIASHDKWLAAFQLQTNWHPDTSLTLQQTLAYYDFINIMGQVSSPCYAPTTSVSCDTDDTRPLFEQKGNTFIAIRQITVQNQGDPVYEYYGLASGFRIGHAALTIDSALSGPMHAALDLEYAHNFAFDSKKISERQPINNLGPCTSSEGDCSQLFKGGANAYQAQLRFGYPQVDAWGQWQGWFGYKHIESDAVVDAFADQDFHLGGTNARGFYVGGMLGIANHSYVQLRYFSANEVSGPPLAINVLQLDTGVNF